MVIRNRKVKIVATMGPASSPFEMVKKLIIEGVDVFRLNFSHGSHEEHLEIINNIRKANKELNSCVAIIGDLQGPKIRVGKIIDGGIKVNKDDIITFTDKICEGTKEKIYISYKGFANDVKQGETILLDDGKVLLEVLSTNKVDLVKCKVISGSEIKSNKGVNLPNTKTSLPCLTEKDLEDLNFILKQNLDFIALSFVRSKDDIIELRKHIDNAKSHSKIISKIEKPEAIDNILEIMNVTDAVMLARGDLGVEVPYFKLPIIQKKVLKTARIYAKPIIVATHVMESMITFHNPTRAEVTDAANALLDGADAIMLSGETSVGVDPVNVVNKLSNIIHHVEKDSKDNGTYHKSTFLMQDKNRYITNAICQNTYSVAQSINAKAIITMTNSGYSAFNISSYRPNANIYVFTSNKEIINSLSLVWGVQCFYYDKFESTDNTITDIIKYLKDKGLLEKDDYIVNTVSIPLNERGMINSLKISKVD